MRPPNWRTTTAFHLRALWRRLLIVRYDVQVWLEEAWERHVVADDPYDRALDVPAAPGPAIAIPWVGPGGTWYRDGRADMWVADRGIGREDEMVHQYLVSIQTEVTQ